MIFLAFLPDMIAVVPDALGLIANARVSFLFGDFTYAAADEITDPLVATDAALFKGTTTMRVYEMQIGADYQRELRNGSLFFAKVAWEAQIWEGVARDAAVNGTDMGLMGGTIAIGIDR